MKPGIATLKSLGWPAYLWANRWLAPWDQENDILLDLGGGTGNFSYWFKDKIKRIAVIDFMLLPLITINEPFTFKIQGDIFHIPLKDGSVSKIIFSDVMEHLLPEHVSIIIREIYRILNKNGTVFVNTSCFGFYLRRYFYRAIGKDGTGRLDWADLKDGHFNRLKHKEMVDIFSTAGFQINDYRFTKHFFQPIPQILRQLLRLCVGNKKAKAIAINLDSSASPKRFNPIIQAIGNLWASLDPILLGKIEGGAVFYKLVKL
jgi:ubiquinone/menaquinone biosynthesis C-methylase UbiE